jgi:hypothetical protein
VHERAAWTALLRSETVFVDDTDDEKANTLEAPCRRKQYS